MPAAGILLAAAAPLLVRAGWQGKPAIAWLGWAVFVLALALHVMQAGAWGAAMAFTVAIAVALLLLVVAALQSAPGRRRNTDRGIANASAQPVGGIPAKLATFLLAGPVMAFAAVFLALGIDRLMMATGAQEADAMAAALLIAPVAWTLGMVAQLSSARRFAMLAPPLFCMIAGGVAWLTL